MLKNKVRARFGWESLSKAFCSVGSKYCQFHDPNQCKGTDKHWLHCDKWGSLFAKTEKTGDIMSKLFMISLSIAWNFKMSQFLIHVRQCHFKLNCYSLCLPFSEKRHWFLMHSFYERSKAIPRKSSGAFSKQHTKCTKQNTNQATSIRICYFICSS